MKRKKTVFEDDMIAYAENSKEMDLPCLKQPLRVNKSVYYVSGI